MAQTPEPAPKPRGRIVDPTLLVVAVMWGTSHVTIKWLLGVFTPGGLVALRMGVIALLMAALLLSLPRRHVALRDRLMLVAFGGALVAAQILSFAHAMKMTSASEGSLLISTAPVWTALIVATSRMERVTGLNWLGIGVASTGVGLVIFGAPGGVVANAPARLSGNLLMLASAWMYGGYMAISRRWMQRLGELHVTCTSFAAGGVVLAVVGARQLAVTTWADVTLAHWFGMAYVTVLVGFVGLIVWYRTIGRTSAFGTAAYQYLVPGVSVLAAALFLGERLAVLQLVGIAVTLAGVYMVRVPPHDAPPQPD